MDKSRKRGHFTRIRTMEAYKENTYSQPRHAALRVTESYYNYTGKVLYLSHRNNIMFPLTLEDKHMNIPSAHVGKLIVEQTFLVAYDRVDEFINQLMIDVEEDVNNQHCEQQRVIEAITSGDHIEKHKSGLKFTIRYIIGGKAISDHPKGLYLTNLDVCIGLDGNDVRHPYSSKDATSIFTQHENDRKALLRSNFTVTLIDNAKRFDSLYINIQGDVMEIKPTMSESLEDGIWIHRSSHTSQAGEISGIFVNGPTTSHYETLDCLNPDNVDAPMIYYNPQECLTYGDEVRLLEKKYQLEKQRLDKEAAEAEERAKRLEESRKERDHQRKIEELERKAKVDRMKDERSVGVEILKIGGALVTGIGIALAAVAKFRD